MGQMNRPSAGDDQQRLERAIATYLDDVAQGKPRNPDDLLAAHPESADALRQFLEDHERLMRLARSWRSDAPVNDNELNAASRFNSEKVKSSFHQYPRRECDPAGQTAIFETHCSGLGQFGDYELLHEIARGGMGVVYKARQVSLNRIVAIKMILQNRLQESEDIERFRLESQAIAKLTHPHIVVIHDVGQNGEQHYFSMEFVAGQSLAELIRRGSLTKQKAAEYVEQVARAVHFAHEHGVIHRDIKPSNVLIDENDRARVTDFGLAKHIDRGEQLTVTGQLLGTPAYMAPEQITSRRGVIGPSCDVYGLGVLLYESLTGQPPYRGRDHIDTLLQILECDPPEPRQLNPQIPRDLELICLKSLEKDPKHRYASAAEVADDLSHYLVGDSISLTSPNLMDTFVRTLERSHYDREFHTWSRMLLHLAWISLATHLMVFLNRELELPHPLIGLMGTRLFEIVGMGAVMWGFHKQWYPPRGAPGRQLLSLWLGYMAGSLALVSIAYILTPADTAFNDFLAYPPMAVLASLLLLMLGSSYWGYCYILGAVFLALAFLMTLWLGIAPLLYGVAWAASLLTLSRRLGRLAESQ
ncbi:serine/threonine-protein kinase [Bythopirellula polymerisocia]|uniref:non-specific serine/threonine protein kinase n=1 Tax=Bythopirellula polymerisocia TaxID=2528003 RepID=A0A5C6CY01_9BACT|nr:serine/threonine-protein kinase [Bythopirellula polymerisocia]TWU29492.1 Serine/threonine-protein kinase PrkC [Bythopirellula polymerisocia]